MARARPRRCAWCSTSSARPRAGSRCSAAPPGRANARDIGFLPEERGLYRQMTAIDTIVYFGRLKGMTAARCARRGPRAARPFRPWRQRALDHRQAVQGHGAEGPARDRARQPAAAADPRRALLGPRSGQPGPARRRDPAAFGATARRSSSRPMSCSMPSGCATGCCCSRAGRKKFEGTLDEARGAVAGAAVGRRRASRWRRSHGRQELRSRAASRRTTAGSIGTSSSSPASRPATCSSCAPSDGFPLRRFDQRRASLHDVFLHLVGAAEARP